MRPSDRTLRRWLNTGRPRRIERLIERADISQRLEVLTQLNIEETEALRRSLNPIGGFENRISVGVRGRLDIEVTALILDLGSLGWHTATSLLGPDDDPGSN